MPQDPSAMHVGIDPTGKQVTLEFTDIEATRDFFAAATRDGGFMVPFGPRPQPFATLAFEATYGADFGLRFQARVVQISERDDACTVAFLLVDWTESKKAELERKLAAAETAPSDESEHLGASPIFRIKGLDPGKKMILAAKADRGERQILCRDTSPQVLLSLLANPRIEAEDVLAIVKSTHATPSILQRVAGERRWISSAEIRTAVVRNPKTPGPLAVRLLDTLPLTELREMAKMGSLREDVRRAAFRVYTKMTSQR
jgi:hypothetical protein